METEPRDLVIMCRKRVFVNTDPQRRCYDGVFYSYKYVWGPWEVLEFVNKDESERRLEFWRELNDYAVSQRGKGARSEFKLEAREMAA